MFMFCRLKMQLLLPAPILGNPEEVTDIEGLQTLMDGHDLKHLFTSHFFQMKGGIHSL